MPTVRSMICRTTGRPLNQLASPATGPKEAARETAWISPNSRLRAGTPCSAWYRFKNSAFMRAMSTVAGLGQHLAGVKHIVRVAGALELGKGAGQARAKDLLHEFAARQAVAVLAAHRAAQVGGNRRRFFGDAAHIGQALGGANVDQRP